MENFFDIINNLEYKQNMVLYTNIYIIKYININI
jgi:hypothetical protein